jgi:tRNA nucleotidyltransferase/poly(A) polymerase
MVRASIAAKAEITAATRLAALGCRVEEDALRITEHLRLSNAERDRMLATLAAADALMPYPDDKAARRALYQLREEAFRDGVFQAFAWSHEPDGDAWQQLYRLPDRWKAPTFPFGGRDIVSSGVSGPAVGAMLRNVEAWWIEQDFAPDETALRARLQQMIAAQQ